MKEIAEILINLNAVKVSINPPFTWTSGIKSPVYCDNRILISYPEERTKIVDAFIKRMQAMNLEPDIIAGTATAGIPWAALLAERLNLPMIFVRSQPKEHGTKKQIEGKMDSGSKVLIIEDLISTGGSSIVTAEAIENEGASEVLGVLAIMSWELPKADYNFNNKNIELFTLTGFTELISIAAEKGQISEDQIDTILKFREDPPKWGNNL